MQDLFRRCQDFIKTNSLLKPKEKSILAVSGGPDSVFLFHLFLYLRQAFGNEFVVAHFNHSLRKDSDQEEEFVERLCAQHRVKCITQKKDVGKFFKGDSLEQTARNLRYDFFLTVSRRCKIKKIGLAHHKDDLIETVLLRMIRGSGLLGLRGMLPLSKYKKVLLLRPLLFLEKDEILKFLKNQKITYMVDASNLEDVFLRNKIRHSLIPCFAKISPHFKDSIYNLARNISWDYDFIYEQASLFCQQAIIKESLASLELSIKKIAHLHKALLYNLVRIAIAKVKGNLRRIDSKHIEQIVQLLFTLPKGSVVDIPGLQVIKKDTSLLLRRTP
jgi:tRNA(Ile)-lysidine synthase